MNKQNKNKAFTIIEVVLVLAVAGLIFLVVFAAIPRLQASRRDNQRKRDAEALAALVIEFSSNVGRNPTRDEMIDHFDGSGSIVDDYIGADEFLDPSTGLKYIATNNAGYSANTDPGVFYYYHTEWKCDEGGQTWSPRTYVESDFYVIMRLERGVYCADAE